jgi:ribosome-associated toxin RatA of RatAB toxin-antitoxin module
VICELCQSRPAEKLWVDEESGIVEHLCNVCYGFREEGDRFGKIARWEAEEPEARLAWVKLHLDYDWANFYIRLLFEEFVDHLPASLEERERRKAEFRPIAPLSDLTRDYHEMAEELYQALLESGIGEERMEMITAAIKDFYIIKLENLAEVRVILKLFKEHLHRFFSRCLGDSPVRISISVGQVKSPFHEHWQFLKQPKEVINLLIAGKTRLEIGLKRLEDLESIGLERESVSSFLNKMAEIERRTGSRRLTEAELRDSRGREGAIIKLYNLYASERLSIDEILGYYALSREGG